MGAFLTSWSVQQLVEIMKICARAIYIEDNHCRKNELSLALSRSQMQPMPIRTPHFWRRWIPTFTNALSSTIGPYKGLYHPLHYWKENQHRFPWFSKLAIDVLGVPASTGSVERAFSVATHILSAKRLKMKADLFEALMLIKCNKHLV